jgi:hypothetical protein
VGGAALRASALSDPQVIALINDRFVPVWVNIRKDSLPPTPVIGRVLLRTQVDPERKVSDLFSQGFFLRSLVLTPDGETLLNPQAETVDGSLSTYSQKGYFAYAQVKPQDYLIMLQGSLRRFEQARARASR